MKWLLSCVTGRRSFDFSMCVHMLHVEVHSANASLRNLPVCSRGCSSTDSAPLSSQKYGSLVFPSRSKILTSCLTLNSSIDVNWYLKKQV